MDNNREKQWRERNCLSRAFRDEIDLSIVRWIEVAQTLSGSAHVHFRQSLDSHQPVSSSTMGETKWFLLAVNKTLIQIRIVSSHGLLTTSTTRGYFEFCVLKPIGQWHKVTGGRAANCPKLICFYQFGQPEMKRKQIKWIINWEIEEIFFLFWRQPVRNWFLK